MVIDRPCAWRVGPWRPRTSEQVSLDQVDLRIAEDRELRFGLHSLGDDARPDFAGEGGHGADQGTSVSITVEGANQLAIQLEEVRRQLDHVAEGRVAGPGVVDGHADAPDEPRCQVKPEPLVVVDDFLFGELDDQALRKSIEEGRARPDRPTATG